MKCTPHVHYDLLLRKFASKFWMKKLLFRIHKDQSKLENVDDADDVDDAEVDHSESVL